ncbi:hypothetical protein GQ54DRAFT_36856 [Martensiomyces pterosporus]|nr:hypothetical protein GQ54DRAFT_36856 [Martensiomyces pterosporus]
MCLLLISLPRTNRPRPCRSQLSSVCACRNGIRQGAQPLRFSWLATVPTKRAAICSRHVMRADIMPYFGVSIFVENSASAAAASIYTHTQIALLALATSCVLPADPCGSCRDSAVLFTLVCHRVLSFASSAPQPQHCALLFSVLPHMAMTATQPPPWSSASWYEATC